MLKKTYYDSHLQTVDYDMILKDLDKTKYCQDIQFLNTLLEAAKCAVGLFPTNELEALEMHRLAHIIWVGALKFNEHIANNKE